MPKIIRRSGAGASGAAGSGSTPGSLQITFSGSGQQGVAFSGSFVATGGVLPYTFSIFSGSLPTGLTLNTATGRVSGTPSVVGVFSFTGRVTDAASTTADLSCSVNIAQPSGASALIAVATTTGRDVGHSTDVADPVSRLVSFSVGAALAFASTPTQYNTIYLSQDAGTTWLWAGWWLWTASGQEFFFNVLRPTTAGTWKLAAVPGTIQGTNGVPILTVNLPTGRVFSSTFAVAALAVASPTLGVTPTPSTGAAGSWPYNQRTADGSQYWSISALNIAVSGAFADPNVFVITSTFQDLDSSHNPIGPEHIYGSVVPVNGSINIGRLDGDYGTDGYSYTRTGNIAYVRWKLRASNRVDQTATAWTNPAASILQTDVGSGAGYVDILVAAGGALPPGKVLGSRLDPASLGGGTQLDPRTGTVVVPNQNSGASLIADASFQFSTAGTLGSGGLTPGWNWGLGPSASAAVRTDGGNSDANYVRLTGGDASLTQMISVQPGLRFYVQVAARSSNTGGAAHAVGLYVDWLGSDLVTLTPYTTIIGTVSGYVSAWTNPAVSGYLTAPAGAAFAIIKISTSASEPGYWDVDDLLVQPVVNQTANGVTATTAQGVTGQGTAVFSALTPAAAGAVYGHDYAQIAAAVYGEIASMGPNFFALQFTRGGGGLVFFQARNDDNTEAITFGVDDAGVAAGPHTIVRTGGVSYVGYNGTVQAAYTANKPVKAGIICA